MKSIPNYARGKRDPDSVRYADDRLRPITEATYGCCIYQEQLMEIAKQLGGFSGAEADDLRKAIGKKKRELMATMEAKFIEGCAGSGTDTSVARNLWSIMTDAADYSFNKSHAACYALISYRTAYLKANYPAEYMAAVISSVMSTKDKVPFFVNRCEEMGIEVLPPDVNISDHGFVVSGNNIRFGLDAVKNVGHSAVEAILKAREERPFDSLWDFCERVDARAVNKRATECLIKCGGLDSTEATRKAMLATLPKAQSAGGKSQEDAARGQASIFALDDGAATGGIRSQHPPILGEEFEQRELLAMEKETMGTFLSDHPLSQVREALRVRADCTLAELEKKPDGAQVTVGGIVAEAKKIRTKTGADMMFATLDDLEGRVEMIIFAKTLASNEGLIDTDAVLLVRGRVDRKDRGEIKLVVFDAETFEPTSDEVETAKEEIRKLAEPVRFPLQLDAAAYDPSIIEELKSVFSNFPGEAEVVLEMKTREGVRRLRFGSAYRVDASVGLRAEIEELLGEPPMAA